MTSLAEKEGLKGKVQTIYFDPPYGIKFGSNWQVSTRKRDVKDGKIEDLPRQPEQIHAFRDTWKHGIHSDLPTLRDSLVAARELLGETGSVFLQIGDENVHLVRCVMDEVFGSENFVSLISCAKTTTTTGRLLPGTNDYLLWYRKDIARTKYRPIYLEKEFGSAGASNYNRLELEDETRRAMTSTEKGYFAQVPRGSRRYRIDNLTSPGVREARTGYYPIEFDGYTFLPQAGEWKTHKEGMERLRLANRLAATGAGLYYVRFMDDFPAYPINNSWIDTVVAGFASEKLYVVQTNPKIIERVMLMTTDPGDLVLDPTCGSGTTAYVAEQWGRRWITVDTSRVALSLARTRLMAARYPYYLLIDSSGGIKKEAEFTSQEPPPQQTENDVRKGFVYKRVPHVAEEAKRYGKLTVLPARMNPDLLIGTGNESLLKNTGAGNLFMVFGEPDVEVKKKGNDLTVEIKGVDVYDPTTGQIRNASTDDIACWFIDTDHNGESFFVRHAYFTGADEPY
jgi:adenine-specific DNA-methyltransferase